MTQISDTTAQAREQARDTSGEFGNQSHAEAGIVTPPMCDHCYRPADVCQTTPCVQELLSRNNRVSISVKQVVDDTIDEHGEDDFRDRGEPLDMQIRYVMEAMSRHGHLRTDVYCEPQFDNESGDMYGANIGFKNKVTGCDVTLFLENDEMFDGIDGTEGRERVTIIATEIAKVYDAVYDCHFPEERAASDAFFAEHPQYA